MKRLLFGSLLLLALPLWGLPSQPNLLFILADDLGWADTELYGHTDLYQTPNLKRLAAMGMTFERGYCASPLCSPTRSSILTGLHPARTGLTTPGCHTPTVRLAASTRASAPSTRKLLDVNPVTRLDPKYLTLAEVLKQEGYATLHAGKWHLGAEPYSPLQHGFDLDVPHWHGPGPAGSYVAPWKFPAFKEAYAGEHIEDRMGDEIVRFLKQRGEDAPPFFINYWQFSVHGPFNAKQRMIERYRNWVKEGDEQRSPTYAAMVHSLDENVGKVLDALEQLGVVDETIIVFFSDNGGNMYNEIDGTTPTSNRPLRGGKGNNWDGGVRVPAIVAWPGETKPGSRSDVLLTSTDFFPTLMEMLEVETEQKFDGVSVVPALRGDVQERGPIYTYFPHSTKVPDTLPPSAAVYEGDWKLIRLFHNREDGAHEFRLFNLREDIGERDDRVAREPARVAAMDTLLEAFLQDCKAVTPRPNPAWASATAMPAVEGWKASHSTEIALASLDTSGTQMVIRCTGADPHVTVRLAEPIAAGALRMKVRLLRSTSGPLEVRWSSAGMRPAFNATRLVKVNAAQGEWVDVAFSFQAADPVSMFRFDPGVGEGRCVIASWVVERDGVEAAAWRFAAP